jgi:hypothetical protein
LEAGMTNSGYRSLRSRKTIGWQAEAPAPPKRKPPRAKVGQALSPVNPAVSATYNFRTSTSTTSFSRIANSFE